MMMVTCLTSPAGGVYSQIGHYKTIYSESEFENTHHGCTNSMLLFR